MRPFRAICLLSCALLLVATIAPSVAAAHVFDTVRSVHRASAADEYLSAQARAAREMNARGLLSTGTLEALERLEAGHRAPADFQHARTLLMADLASLARERASDPAVRAKLQEFAQTDAALSLDVLVAQALADEGTLAALGPLPEPGASGSWSSTSCAQCAEQWRDCLAACAIVCIFLPEACAGCAAFCTAQYVVCLSSCKRGSVEILVPRGIPGLQAGPALGLPPPTLDEAQRAVFAGPEAAAT